MIEVNIRMNADELHSLRTVIQIASDNFGALTSEQKQEVLAAARSLSGMLVQATAQVDQKTSEIRKLIEEAELELSKRGVE